MACWRPRPRAGPSCSQERHAARLTRESRAALLLAELRAATRREMIAARSRRWSWEILPTQPRKQHLPSVSRARWSQRPTSRSRRRARTAAASRAGCFGWPRGMDAAWSMAASHAEAKRHARVVGEERALAEPQWPRAGRHTTLGPPPRPLAAEHARPCKPRMSAHSASAASHHAEQAASSVCLVATPGPGATMRAKQRDGRGKHPSGSAAGTGVGARTWRTESARGCARSHNRTPLWGLVAESHMVSTRWTRPSQHLGSTKKSRVRP
jgi:hypothetical protein